MDIVDILILAVVIGAFGVFIGVVGYYSTFLDR